MEGKVGVEREERELESRAGGPTRIERPITGRIDIDFKVKVSQRFG